VAPHEVSRENGNMCRAVMEVDMTNIEYMRLLCKKQWGCAKCAQWL